MEKKNKNKELGKRQACLCSLVMNIGEKTRSDFKMGHHLKKEIKFMINQDI